jgi:hypothetical protein
MGLFFEKKNTVFFIANLTCISFLSKLQFVILTYKIGNDASHTLTKCQGQELRVELFSFADEKAHALYSTFQVGNESSKYQLKVSGFSGTAGMWFSYTTLTSSHKETPFLFLFLFCSNVCSRMDNF